ncbi:MAG TPA: hypothetical protein VG347_11295 [Verrucomicrobiae bacterium]|nr:hypothetical protein [Verrucomicrobiae bacterium]
MKQTRLRFMDSKGLISLGLGLVLCLATACHRHPSHKKLSPEAVRQARLEWNLKTLVDVYLAIGNTNAKWDEAATNALAEFAQWHAGTDDERPDLIIATNCETAVQAGCDDPMVRYLYVIFAMSRTNSSEDFTKAYRKMADDMQESGYPPVRKFYASLRTAEMIKYGAGGKTPPEVHPYRHFAMTNLMELVSETNVPPTEAYDACTGLMEALVQNKKQYEECYHMIEGPLMSNWPDESFVWLLKGKAYIKKGWFARGGGVRDTVSADAWKAFQDDLTVAETSLEKAWELDPKDERIAIDMIRVAQGRHKSLGEMDVWFARAMAINPNSYAACDHKLQYLYPQWYGSQKEMLEFGRACVQNPDWGGKVPLILPEVHRLIRRSIPKGAQRDAYLKQPWVWADLSAAYERYFAVNPGVTDRYYDYAWYAYQAEQWDTFTTLVPRLGKVDYSYFGGEEVFNQMVQSAKEHGTGKPVIKQDEPPNRNMLSNQPDAG